MIGNRRQKQDKGRYRHWRKRRLEKLREKEDEREMGNETVEIFSEFRTGLR